jgi:putative membrane protein
MAAPANPPVFTDPRSLLAAERTLLAWLRTGLSLIGFGFLIARIGIWLEAAKPSAALPGAGWMGALFGALGCIGNLLAIFRYLRFRRAILSGGAVPTSRVALVSFAASVTLLGALLGAVTLLHLGWR